MNMAVAYQRDREPRRRSHERVETARVQVRTKSRPRHLAVSARGMLVMVIVSSLLFCVLVGLIYIKYLIADTQLNINTITEQIHESSNEHPFRRKPQPSGSQAGKSCWDEKSFPRHLRRRVGSKKSCRLLFRRL